MARFAWHGDRVYNTIAAVMAARLSVVGQRLQEYIQQKISEQGSLGNRSEPGEPPKRELGGLIQSMFHEKVMGSYGFGSQPGLMMEMVGSDSMVAVWQELGTGRYHHDPDPTLTGLNPPHTPRPDITSEVPGQLLSWDDYGEPHWALSVKGIARRPFMAASLHEMADDIIATLCAPIIVGAGGVR